MGELPVEVSWLTAMAVERLASYFADEQINGTGNWTEELSKLTTSAELEEVQGMRRDMNMGMRALSSSINSVTNQQNEGGAAAVLRQLMDVSESCENHNQLVHLRLAADALNDLCNVQMYEKGHPKNVGLLAEASANAKRAARAARGSLMTKLQAYRIWIVTEYMHEAATKSCLEAKKTAMKILGRVILQDSDLVDICNKYATPPTTRRLPARNVVVLATSHEEGAWKAWSGPPNGGSSGGILPLEVATAIEFMLEIISSVSVLPPLNQATVCPTIVEVKMVDRGEGTLTLGPGVPDNVVFAMGRYCAGNPSVATSYPAVSALGLEAWDTGKERLAMDNLFVCMGGEHWILKGGWAEQNGELSERFGIAMENGHVTKINLAGNNLQGALPDCLADCEHLRELVLHGNCISDAIPARLQALINCKRNMVVTGLSAPDDRVVSDGSSLSSDSPGSYSCEQPYSTDALLGTLPTPPGGWGSFASTTSTMDTDAEGDSSNSTTRRKRSVSLLRRGLKYAKEAMGSDFGIGGAETCPTCRARLTRRTDAHPQCDACAPRYS